jgi:hypothetical protein
MCFWTQFGSRGLCYLAILLSLCAMAPKANVVQVVPDGYVLIWNYFGAEPVPVVIPIPVPLVPPAPAVVIPIPVPLVPPAPAVVSIVLDYWWEHGFFGCGENLAHDDVNVQWRQFYSQYRT